MGAKLPDGPAVWRGAGVGVGVGEGLSWEDGGPHVHRGLHAKISWALFAQEPLRGTRCQEMIQPSIMGPWGYQSPQQWQMWQGRWDAPDQPDHGPMPLHLAVFKDGFSRTHSGQ